MAYFKKLYNVLMWLIATKRKGREFAQQLIAATTFASLQIESWSGELL